MTVRPSLQQIAQEKNWMEFALQLEAAMQDHHHYGLPDPAAVRAAVGRIRRQLPSSLTTALKAMQFLKQRHPEILETRNASIGCAQVRLLSRIEDLSPKTATELKAKVFAAAIRQSDLRAHHARLFHQPTQGDGRAGALAAHAGAA